LWVVIDGGIADPYDADEITEVIHLSSDLVASIAQWDERYQATLNEDYPPDSGFPSPADQERFVADGRELARRIKAEVPSTVRVQYGPLGPHDYEVIDSGE
jgi:hypothetical protein